MREDTGLNVILGAGPTGRGVAESLNASGRRVRVVTRSGRAEIPAGVEVVAADLSDLDSARRACAGARVVYGCVGMNDYTGWAEGWPPMMAGMLEGAGAAGARFVFLDNLYMYGPVAGPLREEMPLTDYGVKPAVRSKITRMWQEADTAGRVRVVAARASDFYGPGVRKALLGDFVTGAAVRGKTANLLGDPSQPHAFTYVPDAVRALIALADADAAVCGQAWHVPNAPALPVREVVERIYRAAGLEPRMRAAPAWMLGLFGLFDANARELGELLFQWSRPFLVDHRKFAERFGGDCTPMDDAIAATVAWFRSRLARSIAG